MLEVVSDIFANPFRTAPGSEPPHLVGRDAELASARIALGMTAEGSATSPVIITGLRGMGKTVLLRRAAAAARSGAALVIYAEGSRREPLTSSLRDGLEAAARNAASLPQRLKRGIDSVIRALPKPEYELPDGAGTMSLGDPEAPVAKRFSTELRELNDQAHKHDRYLAFFIDEIQEAPASDLDVFIRFIHETAGTPTPAILLGAGLPNARAHLHHVRTYTERWRYLEIGLLDAAQTQEAILKPIRDAGHRIAPEALAALVSESAGYPFFIQEYASAAWMQHRGKTIAVDDVDAIIPGVRRNLEASLYDERFRTLTPRECRYVLALTTLGPGTHTVQEVAEVLGVRSDQVSSIRNQLIKKDVVFAPNAGMLEFRIPLTDRYVKEHLGELTRRADMAAVDVTADRERRGRSR